MRTVDNDKSDLRTSTTPIAHRIRTFITANFLFGEEDERFTDGASFLETGIIDSTGILELVAFVESEFGISVREQEMTPENLDSVNNVADYVSRKLNDE
jgi:acyl carrier protein